MPGHQPIKILFIELFNLTLMTGRLKQLSQTKIASLKLEIRLHLHSQPPYGTLNSLTLAKIIQAFQLYFT